MAWERFEEHETHHRRIEEESESRGRGAEEEALEERVFERTAQLAAVNRQLSQEIGDRKRAEREIAELDRELRSAVAVRDEFLALASHEFKTPVTALQLQLQAVLTTLEKRRGDGPDQGGAAAGSAVGDAAGVSLGGPVLDRLEARLRFAQRQVQRLTRLVDNLLDITHLAAGTLGVELEAVDVGAVLAEVVERHQPELRGAGCVVRLSLGPALDGRFDRLRLDQVFSNLLSNAMKFGARRPIDIHAKSDAQAIHVQVRDQGIGVSPADQERIFDRFARAVSERNYGGFGLGLWLARQAARALGGDITIDSQPGEGASFTVTLPRSGPAA